MDSVFQWIKSIVFYMILLTAVTHLMPNNKYVRYVKIFSGMLMVIVVIRPVMGIFSFEQSFDETFENIMNSSENVWGQEGAWQGEMSLQEIQDEGFYKEYERQVEIFVKNQAKALGLQVVSCNLKLGEKEHGIVPERMEIHVAEIKENQRDNRGEEKDSSLGIEKIAIEKITIEDIVEEKQQSKGSVQKLRTAISDYYGLEKEQVIVTCSNENNNEK